MAGLGNLPREQPSNGIRAGFPTFIVLQLEEGDGMVQCARTEGRCGNQFVVHLPTWLSMPGKTRACPYCFRACAVPPPEMIRSEEL